MPSSKVSGKPHLALFRGFWGVGWPNGPMNSESDPVKEVALWIAIMNHSIVKSKTLCKKDHE